MPSRRIGRWGQVVVTHDDGWSSSARTYACLFVVIGTGKNISNGIIKVDVLARRLSPWDGKILTVTR